MIAIHTRRAGIMPQLKTIWLATSAVGAVIFAGNAQAQATGMVPADKSAHGPLSYGRAAGTSRENAQSTQRAATANKPEDQFGGDIVVTAEKQATSVNKTPIAITALAGDKLLEQNVKSVADLTGAAPNVQIHTVGSNGYVGVSVRGITNTDYASTANPAVSIYVDGIYVALPQGFSSEVYDLDRIEVLRGPQGTLYGRNATGGNLNLVTADPKPDFGGFADLSYGAYNDILAHAVINLPVSETFAVRVGSFIHRSDGYWDTQGTTARNYGAANDFGARLTTLWEPSNAFRWRLSYTGSVSKGTPGVSVATDDQGRPENGRPVFEQPASADPEPYNNLVSHAVRSRMDWDASEDITVSYLAGYQHVKHRYRWATVGESAGPNFPSYLINTAYRATSQSHELNVAYDSGRFRNVFGGAYFYTGLHNDLGSGKFLISGLGLRLPDADGSRKRSWGVFNQATFTPVPELRLTAGIRYSHDSQSSPGYPGSLVCIFALNPALRNLSTLDFQNVSTSTPGCFQLAPTSKSSASYSKITWRAAVDYEFAPRQMAYASVATGYKQGGLQTATPPFPNNFGPETVINYEFGLKGSLAGNTLSYRAAAFLSDYKDLQIFQFVAGITGGSLLTTNAGAARIYGFELEADWRPSPVDRVSSFLTYNHARFTKFDNAIDARTNAVIPSLAGNQLGHAPDWTFRINYAHDFLLHNGWKLTPQGTFYWQSESFTQAINTSAFRTPSYTKSDLQLTLRSPDERWSVSAYVFNIEDKRVKIGDYSGPNKVFSDFQPPRTWGLRATLTY